MEAKLTKTGVTDKMALSDYSIFELEREIDRRKAPPLPALLDQKDFSPLLDYISKALEKAIKERRPPQDFEIYITEKLFDALYGKGIFYEWTATLDWWES
jgi:hypothetical protein